MYCKKCTFSALITKQSMISHAFGACSCKFDIDSRHGDGTCNAFGSYSEKQKREKSTVYWPPFFQPKNKIKFIQIKARAVNTFFFNLIVFQFILEKWYVGLSFSQWDSMYKIVTFQNPKVNRTDFDTCFDRNGYPFAYMC